MGGRPTWARGRFLAAAALLLIVPGTTAVVLSASEPVQAPGQPGSGLQRQLALPVTVRLRHAYPGEMIQELHRQTGVEVIGPRLPAFTDLITLQAEELTLGEALTRLRAASGLATAYADDRLVVWHPWPAPMWDVAVAALHAADPAQRKDALCRLGRSGDPRFCALAAEALRDPDEDVAASALRVAADLLPLAMPLDLPVERVVRWSGDAALADYACRLLGGSGRSEASAVLARLSRSGPIARAAAAAGYGFATDPAATAALSRLADDPDAAVRQAVAQALGQGRDAQRMPILRRLAGDPDRGVRWAVADAAARSPAPDALDILRELLGNPEDAPRVAERIALVHDPRACATLLGLSGRWLERAPGSGEERALLAGQCRGLGRLGQAAAAERLIALLDRGRIPPGEIGTVGLALGLQRDPQIDAWLLARAQGASDLHLRYVLWCALAETESQPALAYLQQTVRDQVDVLGWSRSAELLAPLLATGEPATVVRSPQGAATGLLVGMAHDPDVRIRRKVALALGQRGAPLDEARTGLLLHLVGDPDSEVRRGAALGLAASGDPRAADALLRMARGDDQALLVQEQVAILRVPDPRVTVTVHRMGGGERHLEQQLRAVLGTVDARVRVAWEAEERGWRQGPSAGEF